MRGDKYAARPANASNPPREKAKKMIMAASVDDSGKAPMIALRGLVPA